MDQGSARKKMLQGGLASNNIQGGCHSTKNIHKNKNMNIWEGAAKFSILLPQDLKWNSPNHNGLQYIPRYLFAHWNRLPSLVPLEPLLDSIKISHLCSETIHRHFLVWHLFVDSNRLRPHLSTSGRRRTVILCLGSIKLSSQVVNAHSPYFTMQEFLWHSVLSINPR